MATKNASTKKYRFYMFLFNFFSKFKDVTKCIKNDHIVLNFFAKLHAHLIIYINVEYRDIFFFKVSDKKTANAKRACIMKGT